MALTFSNHALQHGDKFTLVARDIGWGAAVIVRVFRYALDCLAIEAATQVAQAKYAAGQVEADGSVAVRKSDLTTGRA